MLYWEQPKDPDDIERFSLDWSDRLDDGETISTQEWLCDDDDITIENFSVSGNVTTVWLSGGVAGKSYLLTNRITTSESPRQLDQTVRLRVQNQ